MERTCSQVIRPSSFPKGGCSFSASYACCVLHVQSPSPPAALPAQNSPRRTDARTLGWTQCTGGLFRNTGRVLHGLKDLMFEQKFGVQCAVAGNQLQDNASWQRHCHRASNKRDVRYIPEFVGSRIAVSSALFSIAKRPWSAFS